MPAKKKSKVRFIEAIGKYPFLYNKYLNDHRNRIKTDEQWRQLALEHDFESN